MTHSLIQAYILHHFSICYSLKCSKFSWSYIQRKHCCGANRGYHLDLCSFSLQTGPDGGETNVDEGERVIQRQIRQLGHNIPFTSIVSRHQQAKHMLSLMVQRHKDSLFFSFQHTLYPATHAMFLRQ